MSSWTTLESPADRVPSGPVVPLGPVRASRDRRRSEGRAVTEETFGPYRLERLLSRSGTGGVWQATGPSHGLSVTLTRLPLDSAADPDLYVTFRSEAALAARLHEPHIIPIYDFGEIDGQPYIAERVVAGTHLGRLI